MSERNQQPPYERPSLSQLAAQGTGEGWECPRCGCCDWRVINSYYVTSTQSRHRRRECRHCHQLLTTREVTLESMPDSTSDATNSKAGEEALTRLSVVAHDAKHDDADDPPRSDRKQRTRSA